MKHLRRAHSGYQIVQIMGFLLISLMFSSLAIDFGYYYAAKNKLQTAADSATMAATQELYRSIQVDPSDKMDDARAQAEALVTENEPNLSLDTDDVLFGFVDPATKTYNPATFRTPSNNADYASTGGYNAVRVRVRKTSDSPNNGLNTIMANLMGITRMNTQATAVALVDQSVNAITDGGLRPIYACEAQFNRTMQDGIPENNVVRIYGDHVEVDGVQNEAGCPAMGSGNWGFADLTDCNSGTVGASTIRDWFANGYPGTVTAGQCYSTKPGNFISSISSELDTLINNETVFSVPLYDSWSGNGSNGKVNVSAFAGFKISGYLANGSASSRYIEGHFFRHTCSTGCSSSGNGGTSPGGAIVKIRMASR